MQQHEQSIEDPVTQIVQFFVGLKILPTIEKMLRLMLFGGCGRLVAVAY